MRLMKKPSWAGMAETAFSSIHGRIRGRNSGYLKEVSSGAKRQ
jgi:hypothetical protein